MPEWTEVVGMLIGAGGLALAVAAFYLGFKRHRENTTSEDNRHKEAMKAADRRERALEAIIRNTAPRPGPAE